MNNFDFPSQKRYFGQQQNRTNFAVGRKFAHLLCVKIVSIFRIFRSRSREGNEHHCKVQSLVFSISVRTGLNIQGKIKN